MFGETSLIYPPTHYIRESFLGDLNDDPVEIKDDLIIDVVDIMSQSYLNTPEEETEEDTCHRVDPLHLSY